MPLIFNATFDQFNASLLNVRIVFLFFKLNSTDPRFLNGSVLLLDLRFIVLLLDLRFIVLLLDLRFIVLLLLYCY